jgi:arginase
MGGSGDRERGVVWFDAHGDYNTTDTTMTGFFGGMPVAVWTGDCYPYFWSQVSESNPVSQDVVVMVGVRDLDTLERERIEKSDICVVEWRDGEAQEDVAAALDDLAKRVDEVYVHIDLDALDPIVAPGFPDFMAPGGMSLEQVEGTLREIAGRFRIRVATVATFNPEYDSEGKAQQVAMRLIEVLGEVAGSR